ncbi:MAG: hypothetical protein LBV32_07625 [Tannerellaceae bacterium]|jgi:hypothetical protein|nr:hypothetical protein [Tannerellaceae bacterium]
MKTIKLFAVSFICLFLFSCGNNSEEEVGPIPYITRTVDASCTGIPVPEDTYAYPVLPGTDEWEKLSQKEMKEVLKACQVPEDILRKQSTHAVIQTLFDYPFSVSDMYSSSSTLLDGFERSAEYNPAYPELLKRKDAGTCLLERYLMLNPVGCDGATTLITDFYEMLLAQPEFYSRLTAKEKKELVKIALEKIKIRMDFDPLLVYHNETTCLLIGRIMVSAEFASFTKEVANNKELAQYLETQYPYGDYDNILSYANQFIK